MRLWRSADSGLLIVLLLFSFLAIASLFINPIRTTYGVKSDEATYVTMALSVAYDGDLSYQRRDLTRFWSIYQSGPEGIFLKRVNGADDRLFFGKAFIYPLVAAPFVRLAGLNGFLLLNVLLLAGLFACLYAFAAARMTPAAAVLLSTGFLGASITPLFGVWMMPEIFNLALTGGGYFCWLYKEVRPRPEGTSAHRLLWGSSSDLAAAVLLGLATFSKPSNLLLIVPVVTLPLWRRRPARSLQVATVFGLVVAAGFGVNALVSGEFNYQGGERKTFYGHFPFQLGQADFETLGISVTTNNLEFEGWRHLGRNTVYFFLGRHFGLLPYYFPAVLIVLWATLRWRELEVWHLLIVGALVGMGAALLLLLPNTWSGGGGPPGNRYFLSTYPAFFFLIPAARTILPGVIVWVGGALFVAQILVNPFVAAKQPWLSSQSGLLRTLPVELTMVNDLPVRLDSGRSRIPYGDSPRLYLYYLDDNAWRPHGNDIWVAGRSRADIVVRTAPPLSALDVTLHSPEANTVTVAVDGSSQQARLMPNVPVTLRLPVRGVQSRGSQNFVLSIETAEGFIPRFRDIKSDDARFLGARIRLHGIADRSSP